MLPKACFIAMYQRRIRMQDGEIVVKCSPGRAIH
jgi:hypothetical protein